MKLVEAKIPMCSCGTAAPVRVVRAPYTCPGCGHRVIHPRYGYWATGATDRLAAVRERIARLAVDMEEDDDRGYHMSARKMIRKILALLEDHHG